MLSFTTWRCGEIFVKVSLKNWHECVDVRYRASHHNTPHPLWKNFNCHSASRGFLFHVWKPSLLSESHQRRPETLLWAYFVQMVSVTPGLSFGDPPRFSNAGGQKPKFYIGASGQFSVCNGNLRDAPVEFQQRFRTVKSYLPGGANSTRMIFRSVIHERLHVGTVCHSDCMILLTVKRSNANWRLHCFSTLITKPLARLHGSLGVFTPAYWSV